MHCCHPPVLPLSAATRRGIGIRTPRGRTLIPSHLSGPFPSPVAGETQLRGGSNALYVGARQHTANARPPGPPQAARRLVIPSQLQDSMPIWGRALLHLPAATASRLGNCCARGGTYSRHASSSGMRSPRAAIRQPCVSSVWVLPVVLLCAWLCTCAECRSLTQAAPPLPPDDITIGISWITPQRYPPKGSQWRCALLCNPASAIMVLSRGSAVH